MLRIIKILLVSSITILFGCAHPINIAANTTSLDKNAAEIKKINATVGYHIPSSLKTVEVTTGGGGGDSVRYFAYQDLEFGYQRILNNTFTKSLKIDSTDPETIKSNNLDYVLTPTIVTSSGSTSFVTWPPTNFVVDLSTTIKDKSGTLITTKRVVGNGAAEFSEFKSEHGLAGRRAMEDALLKMQDSFLDTKS